MKSFNIYDHPKLITAVNHFVSIAENSDYLRETITIELTNHADEQPCSCWWDCCCCISEIFYCIDKRTFARNADAALQQFLEEIQDIELLDLSYYGLYNEVPERGDYDCRKRYFEDKSRFFLQEKVPFIINYIISQFEGPTFIEKLDLGACELSPKDPNIELERDRLLKSHLSPVIAEKIIKMSSLRTVRTLDDGFAATLKTVLEHKKSLLLDKFLGYEVDDDKLGVNEIELIPLEDMISSFPETIIDMVGEYLQPDDIMIGPEIVSI